MIETIYWHAYKDTNVDDLLKIISLRLDSISIKYDIAKGILPRDTDIRYFVFEKSYYIQITDTIAGILPAIYIHIYVDGEFVSNNVITVSSKKVYKKTDISEIVEEMPFFTVEEERRFKLNSLL
jgi:hypothetical protein